MPEQMDWTSMTDTKKCILIVDDEELNRDILGGVLESHFDILFASDGIEALEKMHEHRDLLSLVFLDLIMPGMTGQEVLKAAREDPAIAHLPVVVLTADRNAEVECLNFGAVDFIPKPYPQPAVIVARAKRVIELFEGKRILRGTEHDVLTGLFHRDFFYHYAEQFDIHNPDKVMDAVVIDINHFHILNERFGKAYGDEVLRSIAAKIKKLVHDSGGFACRLEADTFFAYIPHCDDYASLMEGLSTGFLENKKTDHRIRLRLGVYPEVDKTLEIERRFDRAKVAADTIRGSFAKTIALYDEALHDLEIFEDQLIDDFHQALEEHQFIVHYQPKYDIRPEVPILASAEALVRWDHPEFGLISPGAFIPLFENNGLIRDLDQYVWRETAKQIHEWKEKVGIAVPVSVNVSRIDMYDPNLVRDLYDLLEEYDLTTEDFLLEITESAYTQDSDQIIETVHNMRSLGFKVEMDDFGTGYSSLNMVSSLPIDVLKLDLQFIRNAFSARKNTRMLEVILDIAETLSVLTIAEGVETAEQMRTLRAMGCDYAQGYYFSKPVPPEEYEAFLEQKKAQEIELRGELRKPEKKQRRRSDKTKDHENITYDSLHDTLTGLYNHSAYELLYRDADQEHLALLIIEVSDYKYIYERYGQIAGDNAIRRFAELMRKCFRSVDHICRISRSEFVVIISRVDSTHEDAIKEKVSSLEEALEGEDDGLPKISITAALAFSDRENPHGDLFQDADMVLQHMTEAGIRGLSVY